MSPTSYDGQSFRWSAYRNGGETWPRYDILHSKVWTADGQDGRASVYGGSLEDLAFGGANLFSILRRLRWEPRRARIEIRKMVWKGAEEGGCVGWVLVRVVFVLRCLVRSLKWRWRLNG